MIRLEIQQGQECGRVFDLDQERLTIGRAPSASVLLSDYHLSSEHGVIFLEGDQYIYRDLRSTNGSMLLRGGRRLVLDGSDRWEIALQDGDHLLLGDATSPVIILCRLQPVTEIGEIKHRIIATRPLSELAQVTQKVEHGPDLSSLYEAVKIFGGRLEQKDILEAIAEAVFSIIQRATHISIFLSDQQDEARFIPMLTCGREPGGGGAPVAMSRSLLRRVLKERAAVLAANALDDLGRSESLMGAQIRSTMGVPLWRGDNLFGVIECDNRDASGVFAERELEILLVLAEQAALAIDNARLYHELKIAEEKVRGENQYLRSRERGASAASIIGESAPMKEILSALEKVIDTRATVCITGETGTGKELIANYIHYHGKRREKMFVAQNCAALPENLLESELFGHKKGSFTGADHDKKGLFEIADGGTLFLDEIGEMSMLLQAKLLRVLQEGEIRAVGATTPRSVDVRIICATNRDLRKEVELGRFRQDLFYRLMVFPIHLPPLRERSADLPALAQHFLERYSLEMRKNIVGLSQETTNQLCAYAWPGNIRELENEIQRLVIQVDEGGIILPAHLSPQIRQSEVALGKITPPRGTLKEMLDQMERQLLVRALADHGNNKTQTAATLGITREGLHKKLAKFHIDAKTGQ